MKNYFSYKDPILDDLKSFLVYNFTCASYSSRYIGKPSRHFKTIIEEHIKKDRKSHTLKHLHSIATFIDLYNFLSFKIIDKANPKFDLKIKEVLHINSRKHNLNAQQKHLALTFYYSFFPTLLFSVFFFSEFFFSSIILITSETSYRYLLLP